MKFSIFHVFMFQGIIELNWIFFMIMIFTLYLYIHLTCLLMFSFHESYLCFIDFECWLSCGFHVSWKILCFIPYLKDCVLVNKFFHLTSCDILHYGSDFQTYFNFKSIFENPYLLWADGWETMPMYALYWKSF